MQEGSGLRLLGGERVVALLALSLAGPAVPVPIEAVHVVLPVAAGPVDRLCLTLDAEVATFGPDNRLQYDIADMLGNGSWGYIVGTYEKDAGPNNQRLYLSDTRVAQMSDTLPIDLDSAALGIGRHVSGIADPFNSASRTSSVRTAGSRPPENSMSDPGAFALAGAEEQEGGQPPPEAGAGVVCHQPL